MDSDGVELSPRVWIDDRHSIFRRGLRSLLVSDGFRIAGESDSLQPAPSVDDFDVLVFDGDSTSLTWVLRVFASRPLVAMFASPTERQLLDAVEGGVAAVLLREAVTPRALIGSIKAAASGRTSLPSDLVPQLLDAVSQNGSKAHRAGLSEREVKVLRLLADGEGTRDMAEHLSYSERTVKNIVHDVLMKMNCRNRAHAVALATRQGLI